VLVQFVDSDAWTLAQCRGLSTTRAGDKILATAHNALAWVCMRAKVCTEGSTAIFLLLSLHSGALRAYDHILVSISEASVL